MKSIRLRLIVLFMVVTTTTLGGFSLYEQTLLSRDLEARFVALKKDITAQLGGNLANAVWELDHGVIDATLDAALLTPEVQAAYLFVPGQAKAYAGVARDETGHSRRSVDIEEPQGEVVQADIIPPPNVDADRRKISIGRIEVHFSRERIEATLRLALVRRLLEVLAMNLLLLALLTISLRVVFVPLRRLGHALSSLAAGEGDDMKDLPKIDRIEFDQVIDGFNRTLHKLRQIISRRGEAEAAAREATRATNEAFAQLKATQAELIEKNRQLEQLSTTDALTGLPNRLKLDQVLLGEFNRSLRYSSVFALVLLDIDHFKSINDTFGHQIGDRVLSELGGLLAAETRNVDCLGRWGGEEFLVICPDTNTEGAVEFAEKLRQSIAGHAFPVVGNVTASFGVTSFTTGDSIAALMSRVDNALYQSKEGGRNRVECSG